MVPQHPCLVLPNLRASVCRRPHRLAWMLLPTPVLLAAAERGDTKTSSSGTMAALYLL